MKFKKLFFSLFSLIFISANLTLAMEIEEIEEAIGWKRSYNPPAIIQTFKQNIRAGAPVGEAPAQLGKATAQRGNFQYTIKLFDLRNPSLDSTLRSAFQRAMTKGLPQATNKLSDLIQFSDFIKNYVNIVTEKEANIADVWTNSLITWMENPYQKLSEERERTEKVAYALYKTSSQEEIWKNIILHSFDISVDTQISQYGYFQVQKDKRGNSNYYILVPGTIEIYETAPEGKLLSSEKKGIFSYIFSKEGESFRLFHRFFEEIF